MPAGAALTVQLTLPVKRNSKLRERQTNERIEQAARAFVKEAAKAGLQIDERRFTVSYQYSDVKLTHEKVFRPPRAKKIVRRVVRSPKS